LPQLFNNKYRIPSARLQNWNYANEAMYFITICTKNKENYFGEIVNTNNDTNAILQPTEIGKIAQIEWYKSIEMRPDMNLEFGEFVVMPNHIHGIIMIGANKFNTSLERRDAIHGVSNNIINGVSTDAMHGVSSNAIEFKNKFAPQSKNLSSIIRGFKSAVTTYARKNSIEFDWQTRFHDHIIRSNDAYQRISNYIINNPRKWQQDKFFNK
jgi:hypothetical protein